MSAPTATDTAQARPPVVSVVIPMYNRASTIGESVASVLRQTYTDFEVIVVDDGSTDESVQVVESIDDPRMRLVRADRNRGAAGARNLGSVAATGTWVAFQDSDDEWLPRKLERQLAVLETSGADAVYCGMLRLGGFAPRPGLRWRLDYVPDLSVGRVGGDILRTLLNHSLISTQTLVVRRTTLEQLGGFDTDTTPVEDWELAIRLARLGAIEVVDEPLVLQRFSTDSITYNVSKRLEAHLRIVDKASDLFAQHPSLLARAYYTIAGGYRELGDYAKASDFLGRARRADPGFAKAWMMTALVAVRRCVPLPGRTPVR